MEAYPTITATAETVSKIFLEQIVPRYGITNTIDSDRGSHFTAKVLQQLTNALHLAFTSLGNFILRGDPKVLRG